jgi:CubicO group peptidase (beta-lactamase class C family)
MRNAMVENQVIGSAIDLGVSSLIVNKDGSNVIEFGDIHDTFNVASIRKCFLSALYGIRASEGKVDLSDTLKDFGINDNEPVLTQEETLATIEDLLKLRSGVYHPANYETASAKEGRPSRGSHPHNTFWYYNNWDANVLGTIYNEVVGQDIFNDFKELIANPIGMKDFHIEKCEYVEPDENSIHPAYVFRMSANDLVKFGLLYLQSGDWGGKQIIPKDWVAKSLRAYSVTPNGNGFGYMWETSVKGKIYGIEVGDGAFAYSGYPGHYLVGIPSGNLVLVYVHSLDLPDKKGVSSINFSLLLQLVTQI